MDATGLGILPSSAFPNQDNDARWDGDAAPQTRLCAVLGLHSPAPLTMQAPEFSFDHREAEEIPGHAPSLGSKGQPGLRTTTPGLQTDPCAEKSRQLHQGF